MTVPDLQKCKRDRRKIAVVTAYDALFARMVEQAGIDVILVGDSLGRVVQGKSTTLPVTLDQMIYHGEMGARAVTRALERERIAQENVGLLNQIRDRVIARVAVGEAPRFELVRAEAEARAASG